MENTSHEAKTGGVPNRGSLYAIAAAYSKDAIEALYDLMKNSKNDGIRLGAAKALLNKSLPDLRLSDGIDYLPPTMYEMSPTMTEIAKNLEYHARLENKKFGI